MSILKNYDHRLIKYYMKNFEDYEMLYGLDVPYMWKMAGIYFVLNNSMEFVKVFFSDDLKHDCYQMGLASPLPFYLFGVKYFRNAPNEVFTEVYSSTAAKGESEVYSDLKQHRKHHQWYYLNDEVISYIIDNGYLDNVTTRAGGEWPEPCDCFFS